MDGEVRMGCGCKWSCYYSNKDGYYYKIGDYLYNVKYLVKKGFGRMIFVVVEKSVCN